MGLFDFLRPGARHQRIETRRRVIAYGIQESALAERFADEGIDRFVAPLEEIRDGPAARTWTSWAEVANSSLPKADAVGLVDRCGRAIMRRWEDIEAVCGPFVQEDGFDPPRYRGPPWPSFEQWNQLRTEFSHPSWLPGDDAGGPPPPARRRLQVRRGLRRIRV